MSSPGQRDGPAVWAWPAVNQTAAGSVAQRPIKAVWAWPAVNQTAAGSGAHRPIKAVWAGPAVNQTAAGSGAHRPIKARSNMSTLIQSPGGGRPAVHVHSLCQTAPTARDSDRNRS